MQVRSVGPQPLRAGRNRVLSPSGGTKTALNWQFNSTPPRKWGWGEVFSCPVGLRISSAAEATVLQVLSTGGLLKEGSQNRPLTWCYPVSRKQILRWCVNKCFVASRGNVSRSETNTSPACDAPTGLSTGRKQILRGLSTSPGAKQILRWPETIASLRVRAARVRSRLQHRRRWRKQMLRWD